MENNYSHILVGQPDARKIYIEYAEYLKIIKFAKAGASDGSRGVLLGYKDSDKIIISKIIEALYSNDEGLESPAFSPDSWGRISAEISQDNSGLVILGQFSSHPFVTPRRMDYVMQEKYFSKSANLLFVFDPCSNEEKFYMYDDREYVFLNGFYLYDKYDTPIDLSVRENILRPMIREYELRVRIFDDIKRKLKRQNNIYAVVSGIIILLVIYTITHTLNLENKIDYYSLSDEERIEWKNE